MPSFRLAGMLREFLPPNMQIIFEGDSGGFTRVPNELIRSDISAAQFQTWCRLASLCNGRSGKSRQFFNLKQAATALGTKYSTLHKAVAKLKSIGAARMDYDDLVLCIPTAESIEEGEQMSMSQEIAEQPNRKHEMGQRDAWPLIVEAWNKNKTESQLTLARGYNLRAMIAVETHAKRLNIERPDYGKFVAQVLRGLALDNWWATKDHGITAVFGAGTEIKDTKFVNVEKFYKAGAQIKPTVDYSDDDQILQRYRDKGCDDFTAVKRLEADDRQEAVFDLNDMPEDVWDSSTAYIYFKTGTSKIIHWSSRKGNLSHLFD